MNNIFLRRPHQWSMTLRLAIIFTLTSFSLLVVFALFLYWIFINQLEKENQQFLENKIIILQNILETQQNSATFLHEEFILEPSLYHYYVRLMDADGNVLIETPEMNNLVPISAYKNMPPQGERFKTSYQIPSEKRSLEKYFLLKDATQLINGQKQYIQAAMDISSEQKIIKEYREDLIKTLLFGILISATASIVVTRRGLKPLKRMTQSAERITIAQLNDRLDPASWPKELSHLAVALNHMLDRIEEGFTRLSQFSGDLAHELRIPITNLRGEAEIALSRPRTIEEYQNVIGSSLEEFQRLSVLIENLLFLARAENPKAVIDFFLVDINPVFKQICDYYEVAAEEQDIQLSYEGAGSVRGDPLMLRQAISNLVSNALKYTPKKGTITLSVQTTANTVEISVRDTGKGIPAEHLPYLFNRFYRVDPDRSQTTGGTGLGLAIVKSIMDLHQGKVTIISQIGKGTTVTLIFPQKS